MRTDSESWTCPRCKRQFERQNQGHSCKVFPLAQHFEGREKSKALYDAFRAQTRRRVGPFKVESLECCIHFVSSSTFVAVRILKDKIEVELCRDQPLRSRRIKKCIKMSTHRYLCFVDVLEQDEIDDELLGWVEDARDLKA